MSVATSTCPSCESEVLEREVFASRECPECETDLEDLYRLAAGKPRRSLGYDEVEERVERVGNAQDES